MKSIKFHSQIISEPKYCKENCQLAKCRILVPLASTQTWITRWDLWHGIKMQTVEETVGRVEEMRIEWFVKSDDRAKKRSDNDGIIQTNSPGAPAPTSQCVPLVLILTLPISWLAHKISNDWWSWTYRNYFCHFCQSWIFYGRWESCFVRIPSSEQRQTCAVHFQHLFIHVPKNFTNPINRKRDGYCGKQALGFGYQSI